MEEVKRKAFVGDFETTVYEGQTSTEVWAGALTEIGSEEVIVFNNIDTFMEYLILLQEDIDCYFHNLKFDGQFILYYLFRHGYIQALKFEGNKPNGFIEQYQRMPDTSFKYLISDKGQWYTIEVKTEYEHVICFKDSLKLLPFTVKAIGESFKTKHQKSEIEYAGRRKAGDKISDEEKKYIKNDVLVVSEALDILFKEGHTKLTIGSNCMDEFRASVFPKTSEELRYYNQLPQDFFKGFIDGREYKELLPNLYEFTIDEKYESPNAGAYILKSYSGGWCYVKKGMENHLHINGITLDVNSLYPSMMHSISGNIYPIGLPHFWKGDIPNKVLQNGYYYFVRIRCSFDLKKGYLPFIHVRNNVFYRPNECLETSDIVATRDKVYKDKDGNVILELKKGDHIRSWIDEDGVKHDTKVELTLTNLDFTLFKKHYNIYDLEILDGCWFYTTKGIFDKYINKWMEVKKTATGAMRQLAKLFLNNLYGKFATTINSSYTIAKYDKDNDLIIYSVETEYDKKPGYIPIGSAITSYARCFTITAAQLNYERFIYADTDSIHCVGNIEDIVGVNIDSKELCCWKWESKWDKAIFVRQKTYIEHIIIADGKEVKPYYCIKCAGMGKTPKLLVNKALNHEKMEEDKKNMNWDERYDEFIERGMDITDFKIGLSVPGNLKQKRIEGGVVLIEQPYIMR